MALSHEESSFEVCFEILSFADMKKASKDDNNSSDPEEEDTAVFIYDRRSGNKPQEKIRLGGIFDFAAFRSKVHQVGFARDLCCPRILRTIPELKLMFSILLFKALKLGKEKFVIVNTDRKEVKDNSTYGLYTS